MLELAEIFFGDSWDAGEGFTYYVITMRKIIKCVF